MLVFCYFRFIRVRMQSITMTDNNVKKRLLIIDDEANMRHMLATVLKKADYQVETAADGSEGLEMIQHRSSILYFVTSKCLRWTAWNF